MTYFYKDVDAQALADIAAGRLGLFFSDQPEFLRIAESGLRFFGDQFTENRVTLAKNGWISLQFFHGLLCGGQEYKPAPVRFLWDRLENERVIVSLNGEMGNATTISHQINQYRLAELYTTGTLNNIFRPASALAETYADSLLTVDVEKNGLEHRGSGFLFSNHTGIFVVTCKHNVDPADGISSVKVSNLTGVEVVCGAPLLHPDLDLACLPIEVSLEASPFFAGGHAEMFDEVFTLGFPMVPGGMSSLIGHRGEVNGHTELYLAKSPAILISNLVSPGSSGCPVLSRDGLCAGMTIRWAEGEFEAGAARFSCALPVAEITKFCGGLV
ncbi:MAG: serine protease [Alphaproteobacteria bacterium]|nr:MAG: serine protease [Alphaproteobacteria bacterium]